MGYMNLLENMPTFITEAGPQAIQATKEFIKCLYKSKKIRQEHHLRRLIKWGQEQGITLRKFNAQHAAAYKAIHHDYTPLTVYRIMTVSRDFFGYCVSNKVCKKNPFAEVCESKRGIPASLRAGKKMIPFYAPFAKQLARFFIIGVSPNEVTRANAARNLRYFSNWCNEQGLSLLRDVKEKHLVLYDNQLKVKFAPITVSQRLGIVRRFLDYLVEQKVISENPACIVSRPIEQVKRATYALPNLRNHSTFPALIRQSGKKAMKIFCDFIAEASDHKYRVQMNRMLNQFCQWCSEQNLSLHELRKKDFENYDRYLSKTYQPTTVNGYLGYVRAFFQRLTDKGILVFNPFTHPIHRGKRTPKVIIEIPSVREVLHLLERTDITDVTGLRDRAIFSVTFHCLIKLPELIALKIKDFYQREGAWWLHLGKREIPANAAVTEHLLSYIEAAGDKSDPELFLFRKTRHHGHGLSKEKLTKEGVLRCFKIRRRELGLPSSLTSDAVRGAGIQAFLESGGTIQEAAQMTGMLPTAITRYLPKTERTVIYEGALDGLLNFVNSSASGPLSEHILRSGIFRLSVSASEQQKSED
jgi:site-specific recombinase XerD